MRCEFPMLTRCCFCFPLRLGLLVWAYIKTISMALVLSLFLYGAIDECVRRSLSSSRHNLAPALRIYIPIFSILSMDIIFHIFFIISAHKKEHRKIRLFYRYSIFGFILYLSGLIIMVSLFFVDSFYFYNEYFFGFFDIAVLMWIILIQIYVIILVRSEFMKLKRNSNFQFVNHAAEPDVAKVDLQSVEEMQY